MSASRVRRSARVLQWLLRYVPSERLRRAYWERRASDIDATYGQSDGDYPLITSIIETTGASNILDYGCGTGRLFGLYRKLGVSAVGIDVACDAIRIARERYPEPAFTFTCEELADLEYPKAYFDLAISNRVLSGVHPTRVDDAIARLCELSRSIYINELTDLDYAGQSSYWFLHKDYSSRFSRNGFSLADQGVWEGGEWMLFGREPSASPSTEEGDSASQEARS